MNRSYRITTFIITVISAIFAFVLVALLAGNPTVFFDESLFAYNRSDGILVLFGESFPLSPGVVDFILSYPRKSFEFCSKFVWGGMG